MNILLLADLHEVEARYRWVASVAEEYDLVCIGGDVLQLFHNLPWSRQLTQRMASLQAIAAKAPLAFCEGNHDVGRVAGLFAGWSEEAEPPVLVSPGTRIFTDRKGTPGLVVTALPFLSQAACPDTLWLAGKNEQEHTGLPWLVLHHEPPRGVPGERGSGSSSFRASLEQYQPDFVLSGHIHTLAYPPQGAFAAQIGNTWCLNAGCDDGPVSSAVPNHLILDTTQRKVAWYATTDEGDELHAVCDLTA
jgi:Icc-related predicted phosphoesterase